MSKCTVCADLQLDPDGYSYEFPNSLGTSLKEIMRTANRGCQGCKILRDGVDHCWPAAKSKPHIRLYTATIQPGNPPRLLVGLEGIFEDNEQEIAEIEFFTIAGRPTQWTGVGPSNLVPSTRFSITSFEQVQTWLKRCLADHETCKALSNLERQVPTRLLEIKASTSNTREAFRVRLREMKGDEVGLRYACLSHCWGDPAKLSKTELANYTAQKHLVHWSSLTRTYKDAVRFAFSLGVSYLWIDSLCIIQDCNIDWQREAARMASVYQGSYITLAASAVEANELGLNVETPKQFEAHEVPNSTSVRLEDAKHAPVYVRQHFPHWYSSPWDMSISYPILSRGWVYQERLLSPRVLHFGTSELLWECMEVTHCECTIDPVYDPENKRWHAELFSRTPPDELTGKQLTDRWAKMVSEYSKLSLTHPSDRLAAIAGCAKQLKQFRKGLYLAGLWEDTLLQDLLWKSKGASLHRPDKWRAPSWSWVSVDGPVFFETYETGTTYAQIVDVACINGTQPGGGDPYIQIDSGYMVMVSKIIPAQILHKDHAWALGMREGNYLLRINNVVFNDSGHTQDIDIPSPHFLPDYDLAAPGVGCVRHEETVYCLRLTEVPSREVEVSLVLRRVDEAQDRYERIGILFAPTDGKKGHEVTGKKRSVKGGGHARYHDTDSLMDALFAVNMEDVGGPKWFMPEGGAADLYANAGDSEVVTLV